MSRHDHAEVWELLSAVELAAIMEMDSGLAAGIPTISNRTMRIEEARALIEQRMAPAAPPPAPAPEPLLFPDAIPAPATETVRRHRNDYGVICDTTGDYFRTCAVAARFLPGLTRQSVNEAARRKCRSGGVYWRYACAMEMQAGKSLIPPSLFPPFCGVVETATGHWFRTMRDAGAARGVSDTLVQRLIVEGDGRHRPGEVWRKASEAEWVDGMLAALKARQARRIGAEKPRKVA